ncbi:MAG: hypothetical protein V1708_00095 [Candidatus Micrarchaeota archaeon]
MNGEPVNWKNATIAGIVAGFVFVLFDAITSYPNSGLFDLLIENPSFFLTSFLFWTILYGIIYGVFFSILYFLIFPHLPGNELMKIAIFVIGITVIRVAFSVILFSYLSIFWIGKPTFDAVFYQRIFIIPLLTYITAVIAVQKVYEKLQSK